MGFLRPCLSTSLSSGATELAIIEMHDENEEILQLNYDDILGEPLYPDTNSDGIGERTRPGIIVELKCKAKFSQYEEQMQDQVGNNPESELKLTLYEEELRSKGLLLADGTLKIKPNDRLLRLVKSNGDVRINFEQGGRSGLFCYEIRPGETGDRTFVAMFDTRKPVRD
jgi:hypothetical protein